MTDVKLEYTDADCMNLTNYGLFVRMVRPQVTGVSIIVTNYRLFVPIVRLQVAGMSIIVLCLTFIIVASMTTGRLGETE